MRRLLITNLLLTSLLLLADAYSSLLRPSRRSLQQHVGRDALLMTARPPPRPLSSASPEFVDVAQAQFSMLGGSGLQISRAAVYLRREDDEGVLEFIPVAVWPKQGVWVVGGTGSSDSLDQGLARIPAPMLPGGATAESLLPQYPFIERETEGPTRSYLATTMADAGLSVPLVYNGVVLGVLAVWRQEAPGAEEWSSAQRNTLEQVARTLAIAAMLDQQMSRWPGHATAGGEAEAAAEGGVASEQSDVLLREVQMMVHMSVHQLRSPLSAVRTLSKARNSPPRPALAPPDASLAPTRAACAP